MGWKSQEGQSVVSDWVLRPSCLWLLPRAERPMPSPFHIHSALLFTERGQLTCGPFLGFNNFQVLGWIPLWYSLVYSQPWHYCLSQVSFFNIWCVFFPLSHLHFSPTSQAPEAYLQCLDFLVPSGPLKAMCMKIAAPSTPPRNIRLPWKTRRSCARNTTQGLTRFVPIWTWTYGLPQPIGMQISHCLETRVTVGMCEKNLIFKQCE